MDNSYLLVVEYAADTCGHKLELHQFHILPILLQVPSTAIKSIHRYKYRYRYMEHSTVCNHYLSFNWKSISTGAQEIHFKRRYNRIGTCTLYFTDSDITKNAGICSIPIPMPVLGAVLVTSCIDDGLSRVSLH